MKRNLWLLIGLIGLASLAWAHESVTVGPYRISVGQINEPSMTQELNGLDLIVRLDNTDRTPVQGAEKTLSVELISPSGVKRTFSAAGGTGPSGLWAQSGADRVGRYTTRWILLEPGQYTVRVFGRLGDTPIDISVQGKTWLIPDRANFEIR